MAQTQPQLSACLGKRYNSRRRRDGKRDPHRHKDKPRGHADGEGRWGEIGDVFRVGNTEPAGLVRGLLDDPAVDRAVTDRQSGAGGSNVPERVERADDPEERKDGAREDADS